MTRTHFIKVFQQALILTALFWSGSACRQAGTPEISHEAKTIISWDRGSASSDDFEFFVEKFYPEIKSTDDNQLLSNLFDEFKKEYLLAEMAESSGHRVGEDQIDDFIETKITTMSFHLLSDNEKMVWRNAIRRRLAVQKFMERSLLTSVDIEEQAVHDYYQAHQDRYKTEKRYRIRVFQTEEEEKAEELLNAVKQKKEPFVQAADRFTENKGFRIATPMSLEEMNEAFRAAVSRLRAGGVSKIIKVELEQAHHFYVVYLEEIIPETEIPFEDAYQDILREVQKQAALDLLDQSMARFQEKVTFKVYTENLPFEYIQPSERSTL